MPRSTALRPITVYCFGYITLDHASELTEDRTNKVFLKNNVNFLTYAFIIQDFHCLVKSVNSSILCLVLVIISNNG
jgi:hypothetical protein